MTAGRLGFLFVFVMCSFGSVRPLIACSPGYVGPPPIAIADFIGVNAAESRIGRDIARIVAVELERSGRIKLLDLASFIQNEEDPYPQPRFADWRRVNAEMLVYGRVEIKDDNRLRIEFRLWDVFAESQMIGRAYTVSQREDGNVIAQTIADAIVAEFPSPPEFVGCPDISMR